MSWQRFNQTYGTPGWPPPRPSTRRASSLGNSRLARAALALGAALEVVLLARLLPASVLVLLALAMVSVLILALWNPPVTLALLIGFVSWRVIRARRKRRAYERQLDDEIPF